LRTRSPELLGRNIGLYYRCLETNLNREAFDPKEEEVFNELVRTLGLETEELCYL
jgi:hypothetical protein